MKMLSQDELAELRQVIAGIGGSEARQDDLIRFVDAVIRSFIDKENGFDPVQLSLSARANYAFANADTHANLQKTDSDELTDPADEVAIGATIPKRPFTP